MLVVSLNIDTNESSPLTRYPSQNEECRSYQIAEFVISNNYMVFFYAYFSVLFKLTRVSCLF